MINRYSSLNLKRKKRIRAKLRRFSKRLRLNVFRSNKAIYGQIIDDKKRETLVSAHSLELKEKTKQSKIETAFKVGELLAQRALKKKIKEVYFDRGAYKYHGRIKALAEGARKGGLQL